MTNKITTFLIGILSAYLLSTSSTFVRGQCLSNNDDLSIVEDTDLNSIQDFNIDLFQLIFPADPLKNFVFSPYSVWNSLVLAYFGSAGETQRQFEKILRVQDKISTLRKWRQLEYMYSRREETSVNNTFVLSNRAYFDESVHVRICMQNILHNEILQLELRKNPSASADIINKFVVNTTRGHIKQLVNPMDVMNAYLVLVNAAYFKGTWKLMFDKAFTKNIPFTTLTQETHDVPMMIQNGDFRYGFDSQNEYEFIELPYTGDSVSMYIYLPYSGTPENFKKMLKSITPASIESNMRKMQYSVIQVFLPKFKIDSVVEDELLKAVYKMGLIDAFINYKANFTDFSFNRNLKLDRSIHKAFIQVNEEGTEAAAATAFISTKIGGNSEFICNRPFIFFIRDSKTKNILFIGAFQSPSLPSDSNPNDQNSPGVKGNRRTNNAVPSRDIQNTPYKPTSLLPVGQYRPSFRDDSKPKNEYKPEVYDGSIEETPTQSRESYSPERKETNKPKNEFQPDAFQSSVADLTRQPSNFSPREPIPSIVKENDNSNIYRYHEIPSAPPVIPQLPSYPSTDRQLGSENDRPLVTVPLERKSQSQNSDSPIRRFFTYFPYKRFFSDEREKNE